MVYFVKKERSGNGEPRLRLINLSRVKFTLRSKKPIFWKWKPTVHGSDFGGQFYSKSAIHINWLCFTATFGEKSAFDYELEGYMHRQYQAENAYKKDLEERYYVAKEQVRYANRTNAN